MVVLRFDIAEGISIHAPRERSDILTANYEDRDFISIHAPRERSDADTITPFSSKNDFNPRSS